MREIQTIGLFLGRTSRRRDLELEIEAIEGIRLEMEVERQKRDKGRFHESKRENK